MKTATITGPANRLKSFIALFKAATTLNLVSTERRSSTVKQQTAMDGNRRLRKVHTSHFFAGPHGIFDPRLLK
jgi:hypothetical protein